MKIPEKLLILKQLLQTLKTVNRGENYAHKWKNTSNSKFNKQKRNPLKSYFDNHKKGKGIWKWNHYFDIYDQFFNKFIGREVHILEIGIYSGGSLEMWNHYFGKNVHIYGVDIEKSCSVYETKNTKIFIGDQADQNFWDYFITKVPQIDIIIDDGGHNHEQQIKTLEALLPHLTAGGIYLCEDIHSKDNQFSDYLFGLVKKLNEFNGSPTLGVKPTQFQKWIKSIHFFPYVAVIEKKDTPVDLFVAPKHGTHWQPFYD